MKLPACAEHLSDDVKRRFYKNYFKSKKKAFTKYAAKYADGGKAIEAELEAMKKNATVVRVLAHTQIRKVANWGQKKPHVLEIQVRTERTMIALACRLPNVSSESGADGSFDDDMIHCQEHSHQVSGQPAAVCRPN